MRVLEEPEVLLPRNQPDALLVNNRNQFVDSVRATTRFDVSSSGRNNMPDNAEPRPITPSAKSNGEVQDIPSLQDEMRGPILSHIRDDTSELLSRVHDSRSQPEHLAL